MAGHGPGHRSLPLVVLLVSAVLGLVTGVAAVVVAQDGDAPRSPAVAPRSAVVTDPLRVLRVWDARRARAFAQGDAAALTDLYVPGSRTGAADLAVLRGYRERGLRVTGLRTQVLAAAVLRETPRRLVLLVTDVLVGGVAGDREGRRWPLPSDRPSTRRVVLVEDEGWRVAEAYVADGRTSERICCSGRRPADR